MHGKPGGDEGVDNDFAARGFENVGVWILAEICRPYSRPVANEDWKGWWGSTPPYHVPVFVLTHHARPSLIMEGGTTFHFVTGGIHDALTRAREAACPKDIRVGGGVSTIRQYLSAGLIDELHLACVPVLLGAGEPLFAGLDLPSLGYRLTSHTTTANAMTLLSQSMRVASIEESASTGSPRKTKPAAHWATGYFFSST